MYLLTLFWFLFACFKVVGFKNISHINNLCLYINMQALLVSYGKGEGRCVPRLGREWRRKSLTAESLRGEEMGIIPGLVQGLSCCGKHTLGTGFCPGAQNCCPGAVRGISEGVEVPAVNEVPAV